MIIWYFSFMYFYYQQDWTIVDWCESIKLKVALSDNR